MNNLELIAGMVMPWTYDVEMLGIRNIWKE